MMRIAVALVLAVVAGIVIGTLVSGDDGGQTTGASATAPIAPPRSPDPRVPAVSDAPEEGVAAREDRDVQLGVPQPSDFPPASPQRAVAEFLDAWHDRAWDRMSVWTELPRRVRAGGESGELMRRYGRWRLKGWAIRDVRRTGPAATVTVLVAHRGVQPVVGRERLRLVLARPEGGRWQLVLAPSPAR